MFPKHFSFCGLLLSILFANVHGSFPYYGTKIGSLKRLHHGVSGDVYAVDSRTIFIKKFNYDGEAPAAYFYVGNTNKPSNEGAFRLRDERGGTTALTRRYRNKDITLLLPEGKTLRDFKWFSVWCDEFAVNFGDVTIPNTLDYPRPQKITGLKGVHGVASENIVIVDAQTLLVPNFSYDGEAPDAKFWVGRGQNPSPNGLRIPDENGKEVALRRYDRKTIVLTLPDDLTIFDIGHFGVWCEAFTVDFGHVTIPEGLNVPPSLKMLGISPQSKLNCEVLYDDLAFEVRWAVAGESIVVQLVAKLDANEYMSFGISPTKDRTQMIGSDVVVAWVDKETGKGYADDYYMDDKSQCSGIRGVCPERETNSIRLLNAAMVNGYSIVTYQRSLQATDKNDLPISVNDTESIVWAIGPLNERKEASFHSLFTKKPHFINFGRPPTWNCPMPDGSKSSSNDENDDEDDVTEKENDNERNVSEEGYPPKKDSEPEEEYYDSRPQALQRPDSSNGNRRQETNVALSRRPVPTPKPVNGNQAWDIPAIQCFEPEDGVFYAQMGPTGGKHGYSAITGHVGWGISWYINGLLIPEIHVVRGRTYTFVVEGGNNPDIPAKYHPFYITDDPVGGYEHKREEEKKAIRIFAGVHRSRSGQVTPTGVGRLCNWTPDVDGPPADDYQSFGAYQRTLTLKCDDGEPGVITWKPDRNTPDTVYYHCFTHRYLGWKIHVHDGCDDPRFAASEKHEVRLPAFSEDGLKAESSIRHETKVSPNENFLLMHQKDLIKNHNMNGTPPKLTFELTKSSEITKLISDGIRAAEALEESILRNSEANQNQHSKKHGLVNSLYYEDQNMPMQHVNPKNNQTSNNMLTLQTHKVKTPPKLYLSTAQPEILKGETQLHTQINRNTYNNHHHKQPIYASTSKIISQSSTSHHLHNHFHSPSSNFTNLPISAQKTIGLSEYLRPPQTAPVFHPVKLPGRRPNPVPLKKVPGSKPVLPQQLTRHPGSSQLVPQPSVIVNHYRRPVPSLLKPFLKEKPFPIEPIAASVLLLGQPTELNSQRKTEPLLHPKPKPLIPVPYKDLDTQATLQHNAFVYNSNFKKDKKPIIPTREVTLILPTPITIPSTTAPIFKKPFDVHIVEEQPSDQISASLKPAINNGFKPDSVVVESGFQPIRREDSNGLERIEHMANRREDPGSEIDEVMETDTLFITAQQNTQTQNFEPMFIPSPPDSTNGTNIIRTIKTPLTNISKKPGPLSLPLTSKVKETDSQIKPVTETIDEDLDFSKLEQPQIFLTNINSAKNTEPSVAPTSPNNFEDDDEFYDFLEEFRDEENHDEEDEELEKEPDKEAQAAERIDTYYLPPDNRKVPNSKLPSGAVVTYDGKSVIDSSLVLPPKLDHVDVTDIRHGNNHRSKTEQLVRTTPQFKPFTGEIPPEITEFLSTEHSLKPSVSDLTVPFSTKANPADTIPTLTPKTITSIKPISTKLQLLKPST